MTLGLHPLGTYPLAGMVLHDPPTVTATAPTGTVSSGGPYLSTAWTYSQAQGDAQEWFRVQIVNDADTEIYHDSGWLAGADATRDIDVGDPPGVPGDSSDVSTKVYVRGPVTTGIGRFEAESDLLPFIVALGDPHLTIVAPLDGSIHLDPDEVYVDWTFTDDVGGKTQAYYRVRLLSAETEQVLSSTGWVASAATEATVEYLSSDGARMTVEAQAKNSEGILSD